MDENFIKNRLKQICDEKNLTYYQFSKQYDIPHSTIYSIIHGDRTPSLPLISQICKSLNITISQFFRESDSVIDELSDEENELLNLYNLLSENDKEKLKIYLYGLNHKEIKQKDEYVNGL